MKILHLADLHIGKIIYEQSLLEDQEYMLKQIEKIIEKLLTQPLHNAIIIKL